MLYKKLFHFDLNEAKRGNKKRRNLEETMCPICSEKLTGTAEELNGHVELCLKKVSLRKKGHSLLV